MVTDVRGRRDTTGWVSRPAAPASDRAAADLTVLIVDDDPDVLEISQEFLVRAGFRVLTADGGARALELFREWGEKIDVVVLDLSMPGLDGRETLLEIRKLRPNLPVVVASGFGESVTAERFPSAEIACFVRKPYEAEEIEKAVRSALAG